MLVEEKKYTEDDGSIGYYEAIFDSSNILQTTYFPKQNRLYISFNRGGVYSYENVDNEKYEEFKTAESQGKYFIQEIKKKSDKHPYRKEFSLYPEEIKDLKEERDKKKEEIENEDNNEIKFESLEPKDVGDRVFVLEENDVESNNVVFFVGNEEVIRLTPEGFYWKGELVKDNKEIYDKFKLWLNWSFNNAKIISWIKSESEHLEKKKELGHELTQFEEGQLYELNILKQWI